MSAPLFLAVETATGASSVALGRGGELIGERFTAPGMVTAEALLPAIDSLLAETGFPLHAVDAFAVAIGPGSFTGLRIGVATVKGLAFGTERPALPIPTLAALAGHAEGLGPVAAVLDARRGEVYAAGFEAGRAADWLREGVVSIRALAAFLPAGCTLVGEGAVLCADALRDAEVRLAPPPYPETTARHVAALAARDWERGARASADALVPRYVRRAEAEVKRTGERFEPPARRAALFDTSGPLA